MDELNVFQKYIAEKITDINRLGAVDGIEWDETYEQCEGGNFTFYDYIAGVQIHDETGRYIDFGLHDPQKDNKYYQIDCIILNLLLQRMFEENGIDCPYYYPLNLVFVSGLVNDARALMRMKKRGEDLSGFKFQYCLYDLRRGNWVNIKEIYDVFSLERISGLKWNLPTPDGFRDENHIKAYDTLLRRVDQKKQREEKIKQVNERN